MDKNNENNNENKKPENTENKKPENTENKKPENTENKKPENTENKKPVIENDENGKNSEDIRDAANPDNPDSPDNNDGGDGNKPGDDFVLTSENYYSNAANGKYLSNSLFKACYGYPANPHPCEAAALLGPRVESQALLVGSYVDAYFEGKDAFAKFKEDNASRILLKSGKDSYQFIKDADFAIDRASHDPVFAHFMDGEHQRVMTGEIAGQPFKIKMDAYHENEMIVDLKYVKTAGLEWCEPLKRRATFIESYGYALQGAIYQEIVAQNTGKRLPFYIAYITKDDIPDFGVVELPQSMLDEALEYIKLELVARPFNLIKQHPQECGRRSCPYCRDKKILKKAMSWDEFETYSAT